jgi:hypothetical protein
VTWGEIATRTKQRFLLWHPKSTNAVVVVDTADVVVVDEVELLVDASVVAHFVDDEVPH